MNTARCAHVSFILDKLVYVAGAVDQDHTELSSVEVINFTHNHPHWRNVTENTPHKVNLTTSIFTAHQLSMSHVYRNTNNVGQVKCLNTVVSAVVVSVDVCCLCFRCMVVVAV